MLKTIWIVFWITVLITGFCVLVGYFSSEHITAQCSEGLINCLTASAGESFWVKIKDGFICVYTNVICVFKEIGESF